MTTRKLIDWNPAAYYRFRGLRLRPAIDLMNAIPPLPVGGDVIDLGCGAGDVAQDLRMWFGHPEDGRRLVGVDSDEAALSKARASGHYDTLIQTNIESFTARAATSLIFANAVFHWLEDHETLLPRLFDELATGGVFAMQMPRQNAEPAHQLWVSLAHSLFGDDVDTSVVSDSLSPSDYAELLPGADLWETEYYQNLPATQNGHPVRRFTEATFARPILSSLSEAARIVLVAAYDKEIEKAYPVDSKGAVMFPFRRFFLVAAKRA